MPNKCLSPFLFLLCTEGLNGLIQQVAIRGDIKGFSLCWRGPKLTHLLFADDSLIFCRATQRECGQILNILERYEKVLGQKVNKNKTANFFSKSTAESNKNEIKTALGLQEIEHYKQYWVYHPWLEEGRNKASTSLKKRYGENYKVGKENFCLKRVMKYWLRQSFKPSQPLPWGASNYLWGFVMILKPWSRNSGGDKRGR